MNGNLFWSRKGSGPARDFLRRWKENGFGEDSVVKDPKFIDSKGGNYLLKEESPAFELGFKRIDLKGIGPRRAVRRER